MLILTVIVGHAHTAELLRTPKVYNALITTDQNLTPSRAYPVIQPTVHDSPFVYSPYNFSPYGFYDAFGFNGFAGNAQPLFSRYNGNVLSNRAEIANNQAAVAAQASAASAAAVASNSIGNDRSFVVNRNPDNRNAIAGNEKAPIPLNEFGLPPSLVPIAPYGNFNQNPVDLAPYNYNSYPLIFDQYGGFQQGPYLPHFGNVPQNAYAAFGGANRPPPPNENGAFGNAAGGAVANGFSSSELIGNRPLPVGNQNVIGLPGPTAAAVQAANEQAAFNRENFNGGAQHADILQSAQGFAGDGQTSSSQATFQQSSSSAATVSSASSGASDGSVQAGGVRSGRVFYFTDDIKNNKHRDGNIVDVPPPPLPYGARQNNEQ